MESKTIGEQLLDIVKSALDENVRIPLVTMQEMVEAAGYELEQIGYSDLQTLLEDLEKLFRLENTEEGIMVQCLEIPVDKEAPKQEQHASQEQPASEEQPVSQEQYDSLNSKFVDMISKIATDNPDGYIPMTALGQARAKAKIQIPRNEKLAAYLSRFPHLYDVINQGEGNVFVRLAGKRKYEVPPVQEKVSASFSAETHAVNAPSVSAKRFVSLYNLFDFGHFSDYAEAKKQLAELAGNSGEDWFILPDQNESDPYCMVDYKLRINFAMAVYRNQDAITLSFDQARFYTGFNTPDGRRIVAVFIMNQHRDNLAWQTWRFTEFVAE